MWNWEPAKAFMEDKLWDVTLPPILPGLVLLLLLLLQCVHSRKLQRTTQPTQSPICVSRRFVHFPGLSQWSATQSVFLFDNLAVCFWVPQRQTMHRKTNKAWKRGTVLLYNTPNVPSYSVARLGVCRFKKKRKGKKAVVNEPSLWNGVCTLCQKRSVSGCWLLFSHQSLTYAFTFIAHNESDEKPALSSMCTWW